MNPKTDDSFKFDDSFDDFSIFTYYDKDGKPHSEITIYPKPNRFVRWWRGTRLYFWLFYKHYKIIR